MATKKFNIRKRILMTKKQRMSEADKTVINLQYSIAYTDKEGKTKAKQIASHIKHEISWNENTNSSRSCSAHFYTNAWNVLT